jgi:hypothetical protein
MNPDRVRKSAFAMPLTGLAFPMGPYRLVDWEATELAISEEEVVSRAMLGATVDGVFTTVEDVGQTVLLLSAFPSAARTGQSFIVSHGRFMP